jgi:hypothetical protein
MCRGGRRLTDEQRRIEYEEEVMERIAPLAAAPNALGNLRRIEHRVGLSRL